MDQKDTAREVHPVLMFNRPDLNSGRVRKDLRPVVVQVDDELPPRPAPAAFVEAVEVTTDPKKSSSSATSSATPSEPDSNVTVTPPQTPTPTGDGEIPVPAVRDSPDLMRPPLQ